MMKCINKKLMCFAVLFIAIISDISGVFASQSLKIEYNAMADFASEQGKNNWRYQYMQTAQNYESYTDMSWNGSKYVYTNANGDVVNNLNSSVLQPGPWGANTAYVWVAPYSGVIKLTCSGNVRKQNAGSDTTAIITKTDEDCKNPTVLWERAIEGSDKTGTNNTYDIELEIKANERFYFEIKAESNASAETAWTPVVTYTQTASFTQNDSTVLSASDLENGSDLVCTFYGGIAVSENAKIYTAVYDKDGYMRYISAEEYLDVTDAANKTVLMNIPMNFDAESFEGWSIRVFAVSAQSGRCYPLDISDVISVK